MNFLEREETLQAASGHPASQIHVLPEFRSESREQIRQREARFITVDIVSPCVTLFCRKSESLSV
jgi:hypothetical protein